MDKCRNARPDPGTRNQTSGIGVNLEGLKYENWPISKFILRELNNPEIFGEISNLQNPSEIHLHLWRNAWQASSRVKILENQIKPTPLTLDKLTPHVWNEALLEAKGCLNSEKGYNGRAKQTVTLAKSGEKVEREVCPHLQFKKTLWHKAPMSAIEREDTINREREHLGPLYEFVCSRTK